MILFPCQSCSKTLCVDDDCAGQRQPCPYCQASNNVPAESMADCCLVYQSPKQPAGQPMTMQEVQALLEAGRLNANDLIWTDQTWRPLAQVLGLTMSEAAPKTDQPEIALRFEELMPLPGCEPLPRRTKEKTRTKKTRKSSQTAGATDAVPLRERLKRLVFLLVALAVVAFGVVRALRIYNYATGRFATVMLINDTDDNIAFELPFSDMETVRAFAQSAAARENLVVGIPCRKKLKIRRIEGEPFESDPLSWPLVEEFSVPIRPGHNTVVNYGRAPLPVYCNLQQMFEGSDLVPEQLCQAAVAEIAEGKTPGKLEELYNSVQQQLESHFVETTTALSMTDQEYDFSALAIPDGDRPEEIVKSFPLPEKQLLQARSITRQFRNGSLVFRNAEIENLTVKLPSATFRPLNGQPVTFTAEGTITFRRNENGVLLAELPLSLKDDGNLPKRFHGVWTYQAKREPGGQWTWGWLITPTGEKTFQVTPDGKFKPLD